MPHTSRLLPAKTTTDQRGENLSRLNFLISTAALYSNAGSHRQSSTDSKRQGRGGAVGARTTNIKASRLRRLAARLSPSIRCQSDLPPLHRRAGFTGWLSSVPPPRTGLAATVLPPRDPQTDPGHERAGRNHPLGVNPMPVLGRWPPFALAAFPRLFIANAPGRAMSAPLSLKRRD
jgi:hypothetical protein